MNYCETLQLSEKIKDKLKNHRQKIHAFAETGFDTVKTSEYIKKVLASLGIECQDICKNGVLARIDGYCEGKTFLLRCDIDALPIKESTHLDFEAKNGCMHACGHDMHAAMLLGCAEILAKCKDSFKGTALLLFQPAEELLQGAKSVLDSGFDTSSIDGAMTVHVISPSKYPTCHIILPSGGVDAPSADFFKITVHGKGCHGSSPWLGKDPIICACNIINALDTLKAREVSSYSPFTLSIASINGGSGYNVIPEKTEFFGSLRCFDEKVREYVKRRIIEISDFTSSSYGCESNVSFDSGCPCLKIDKTLCDNFEKVLCDVFGIDNITRGNDDNSDTLKGSEDFAYFSQLIPSFTAAIPAGFIGDNKYTCQMHSPCVLFDEDALSIGSAVFSVCALHFLK